MAKNQEKLNFISGAFLDNNLVDNDLEYFFQLVYNFKLVYGVDPNFYTGKFVDASYFKYFVYSEESKFSLKISMGKKFAENQ